MENHDLVARVASRFLASSEPILIPATYTLDLKGAKLVKPLVSSGYGAGWTYYQGVLSVRGTVSVPARSSFPAFMANFKAELRVDKKFLPVSDSPQAQANSWDPAKEEDWGTKWAPDLVLRSSNIHPALLAGLAQAIEQKKV